jgi:hypothetical protein
MKHTGGIGVQFLKTPTGDVLMLTGFVVLAEGLDVFIVRDMVAGERRLPSGKLFFSKTTLVGWMSGG